MKREWICSMLVLLAILSACGRKVTETPPEPPPSTNTPIPSATATATQPPPTVTATITPTIPTPTYTLTPYPSLDEEAKLQLAEELYNNNTGCERLPCWWGTIPGESEWEEVKNYLSSFVHRIPEGIWTGEWSFYEVIIQVPEHIYFDDYAGFMRSVYFIDDGVVEAIEIFFPLVYSINIQTILSEYGAPSEVIVYTWLPVEYLDPNPKFYLILVYKEQGIFAYFSVYAEEIEGGMRGCFEEERVSLLVVWNPQKGWGYEDIRNMLVGVQLPPIYSISEVSNYTPAGFYRAFNGITGKKCIFIDESFLDGY